MNNSNIQLHFLQTEILRKLSLSTTLKFNQLLIENLESVHINYHLQKLKSFGLVKKEDELYSLTNLGKDYTNRMDDVVKDIERQPKTSILINGARKRINGEIEFLLTRRLKHPFFGKVAELTGKIRFGETFEEAARRELFEETGLTAKNFILEKIGRILRRDKEGNVLQDVIFYEFFVTDFVGVFIEKLPYQENFWMTEKEFNKLDPSEILTGTKIVSRYEPKKLEVKEYHTEEYGY
jgi:ADP-ribose pyrophosphatase YjhB (NUDIX family)